ncbi:LacI family DNA-binding transcriptional regulator [Psychromonas sp. 14N.309.X.WAT.B.A12]|uniref:LacI family DNA-binding transcriptional regulator n=1 Tax=Psychromonas sp. 14N.309.X.WAT.B.A12 TaxID=2998322 RepID=UPI0025B060D1|nr:LacI family DNA-binding transcriptional regulator [Psychromonas sp. 14N.309.X.WAT.B.A12]MDN2664576.1 LacI family DNA-binding transcriptional regulator [Psychromonas sp. 14N.309.X.WAT.B.A12]
MKAHSNLMGDPTMKDVAIAAGVASVTVSRYLNDPAVVSDRTKQKIDAAIKQLNYVPHAAARTLASKRSRMIGAVIPSLDSSLFGRTIEVFQNQISTAGYNMMLASNNYNPEKEYEHITQMVSHGMDALILVGQSRDKSLYDLLKAKDIPYVLTWAVDENREHPCIGFNNQAAAADLTRYLLHLGHTKFAMISGFTEHNDRALNRLLGVRATLEKENLTLSDDYLLQAKFGIEEGREAFRLLMSRANKPTAIICGSEPFAYGVIFEAKSMGVKVPEEVSIVGFDDMALASNITPRLTTIRTPQEQMGMLAAKYLVSRLNGEDIPLPQPLTTELVVRESCAPPPKS